MLKKIRNWAFQGTGLTLIYEDISHNIKKNDLLNPYRVPGNSADFECTTWQI